MNLDHRIFRWALAGLLVGVSLSVQAAGSPVPATVPVWRAGPVQAQGNHWIIKGGMDPHGPLCHALLRRLDHYGNTCPGEALATYPKFMLPPWRTLNPRHHVRLIAKLLQYWRVGADDYFHHIPGLIPVLPTKAWLPQAQAFIAQGGQMRVWQARVVQYYADAHPAPPGAQTILELRVPLWPSPVLAHCAGLPDEKWPGHYFIVTPDLKGPDAQADGPTANALAIGGEFRLLNGRPYLLPVDAREVMSSYISGFSQACLFHFVPGSKK